MNTKEFRDLKLETTRSGNVAEGATGLLMVRKTGMSYYEVIDSLHRIILEAYDPVYLLADPPVLAKDLEYNCIFTLTKEREIKRQRVKHTGDNPGSMFAPSIGEQSPNPWIASDDPCTIVKGGG